QALAVALGRFPRIQRNVLGDAVVPVVVVRDATVQAVEIAHAVTQERKLIGPELGDEGGLVYRRALARRGMRAHRAPVVAAPGEHLGQVMRNVIMIEIEPQLRPGYSPAPRPLYGPRAPRLAGVEEEKTAFRHAEAARPRQRSATHVFRRHQGDVALEVAGTRREPLRRQQ